MIEQLVLASLLLQIGTVLAALSIVALLAAIGRFIASLIAAKQAGGVRQSGRSLSWGLCSIGLSVPGSLAFLAAKLNTPDSRFIENLQPWVTLGMLVPLVALAVTGLIFAFLLSRGPTRTGPSAGPA